MTSNRWLLCKWMGEFERSLLFEAHTEEWRSGGRDVWDRQRRLMHDNSLVDIAQLLIDLESSIKYSSQYANWKDYRESWLELVRTARSARDLGKALGDLEWYVLPDFKQAAWNEKERIKWRESVSTSWITGDIGKYSDRVDGSNEIVVELASRVASEAGQLPPWNWWHPCTIFDWVHQNIQYEEDAKLYGDGSQVPWPVEVLQAKKGKCTDMAILFCSLCKAIGISTRLVSMQSKYEGVPDHVSPQVCYGKTDMHQLSLSIARWCERRSLPFERLYYEVSADGINWILCDTQAKHVGDISWYVQQGYIVLTEDSWQWAYSTPRYELVE